MTAREQERPDRAGSERGGAAGPQHDPGAVDERAAPDGERIECSVCNTPVALDGPHSPFCSLRCRSVDLHGWLSGSYQPPGLGEDEDEFGE